ncbi:MAG: carbohydrate kinase [Bacteroidales bacterium]
MRKIFTIGETVYDIIFKSGKPVSSTPGGSMLNTSVSLGRLGLPVSFISEIGKDNIGNMIIHFLEQNKVSTHLVDRFSDGRTALAIAFLDKNNNADYTFYKLYPPERFKIDMPIIRKNDILLFGSFFSISKEVREQFIKIIKTAKENRAICIYDPNFRKPHLKELPEVKRYIDENISFADIVRGSNEDFELILGTKNADDAFNVINKIGCPVLIYTSSDKSVELRSNALRLSVPVPGIELISTIGAGDTFNSGLIYKLIKNGIDKSSITAINADNWRDVINTANRFASEVCQSYDNFISEKTAHRYHIA